MARHTSLLCAAALAVSAGLSFAAAIPSRAATHPDTAPAWDRMGLDPWPGGGMMGHPSMGAGMSGISLPRHRYAMMSGVPAPYTGLQNPLPHARATIDRGREVYEKNCATCHGETGTGDGPAAKALSPHPAYLALLAEMPIVQWDAFMDWTVSEGGAQFGTAMPSFKATLSKDDTWAVIAYIQAHLPRK
jgi:mono/diheme cytochrome c family protein